MLSIVQSGPLLTIQDRGRVGARRWGVPWSGALDVFAHSAANRLIGNSLDAATLEITGGGCVVRFETICVLALAGGDLNATLNDEPIPLWRAVLVRAGAVLRFGSRRTGARAYLAVGGGILVEPQLGSRSTLIGGPFAGLLGRPLRAGDVLAVGVGDWNVAGRVWPLDQRPPYTLNPTVRYLRGPHPFAVAERRRLHRTQWHVSPTSNRMGFRLAGGTLQPPTATLASLGVVPGTIQVPPDGAPIVLLADCQTTGGYPIIGTVINADLPLLAQLLPGDALRLQPTTLAIAEQAWHEHQTQLAAPFADDPAWGAAV